MTRHEFREQTDDKANQPTLTHTLQIHRAKMKVLFNSTTTSSKHDIKLSFCMYVYIYVCTYRVNVVCWTHKSLQSNTIHMFVHFIAQTHNNQTLLTTRRGVLVRAMVNAPPAVNLALFITTTTTTTTTTTIARYNLDRLKRIAFSHIVMCVCVFVLVVREGAER